MMGRGRVDGVWRSWKRASFGNWRAPVRARSPRRTGMVCRMAYRDDDEYPDAFVTDTFAAELAEAGSGWVSADGQTEEHGWTLNMRLWEDEMD